MRIPDDVPDWLGKAIADLEYSAQHRAANMSPTPEFACGFTAAVVALKGAMDEQLSDKQERLFEMGEKAKEARLREMEAHAERGH